MASAAICEMSCEPKAETTSDSADARAIADEAGGAAAGFGDDAAGASVAGAGVAAAGVGEDDEAAGG